MSNFFKKLIGNTVVEEERGFISITNIPSDVIARDIEKIWSTSKVNGWMFTKRTRNSITFPTFFAIEVRYILNQLIADKKSKANVRALKRIIELLETETWLKRITSQDIPKILDWSKLSRLNVKMLPSQEDFLRTWDHCVPHYGLNGYLLAAPAGTGKTLSSIGLSVCLDNDITIVISPKSALERVWTATFATRFVKTPKYWASTVLGTMPPKGTEYAIFHYEALDRAIAFAEELAAEGKTFTIILDECHNLNEISSLRTNLFIELCKLTKSKAICWMSGTPIKAVGSEAVPLLTTIDPLFTPQCAEIMMKVFGKSATRANDILCHRIGAVTFKVEKTAVVNNMVDYVDYKFSFPGAKEYTLDVIRDEIQKFVAERSRYYKENYHNYEDIYERALAVYQAQMSKTDQRDFLKYKNYVGIIRRGFDPVAHKELAKFCNQFEKQQILPCLPKDLKKPFLSARSVIKYVELKIRGEALGRILGRKRIECFVRMAETADLREYIDTSEKKTIIFTTNVEVIDALRKKMIDDGYKPTVVHGEVNKNLAGIIAEFAKDPDINPLIATYDSLSTAVPLIMANTCILFNQPFREYIRNQAISRVDRLDQDQPVHVVNVLLDTGTDVNISTRNLDIVEWSRQQVDSIMGLQGVDPNLSLEGSFDKYLVDLGLLSPEEYDEIELEEEEDLKVQQKVIESLPTTNFYYFH